MSRTLESLALAACCLWPASPSAACPGDDGALPPAGLSAADWSDIQEAHRPQWNAVERVDGGFVARNAAQRWRAHFDGRGFTVRPDAASWTWGLELLAYGRAGSERAVAESARASGAGERVTYDWDSTLREWYANDSRGLEHGFTLSARPPADDCDAGAAPLNLTLAVRGTLRPLVHADGRGVSFVDGDGVPALEYSGLTVFDADGQVLPARFLPATAGLLLAVDERAARYPLTIDPIAQQAYLKASNSGFGDRFGLSVAVSGNTVVVGAVAESSAADGVGGDETDDSATSAGAAYVFVRNGASWTQQAYLKASNSDAYDWFGRSVAISGDTIVVGADGEDGGATGVNGDGADNGAADSGAAYVFVRSGGTWTQQAYLKASNTGAGDHFGAAVAASNDSLVIGALEEAGGNSGDEGDDSAPGAGAAYVFVRKGTRWEQQAYLKASNAGAGDWFSKAVAISGDTIVIGADGEDSGAIGVNGSEADESATWAGAAYVFVRSGTSWSQQAYLKASNTDAEDYFGSSVAVSGDTIVVSSIWEDSGAQGVNGDAFDESASEAGAAYVFVRSGASWSQQAYLKASNAEAGDRFSSFVAASGDTVVVAAQWEDSAATGVNGDQDDNGAKWSGAAYIFVRQGATWSQKAYLKATNTGALDTFGKSVALSGDTLVVGADHEGSTAAGVNGDPWDDSAFGSGAAYVFDLESWTSVGPALGGFAGEPRLVGTGALAQGGANALELSYAAPQAPCAIFVALSSSPVPFLGGTLIAYPLAIEPILALTSASGSLPLTFATPPGLPAGTALWLQYGIQDPSAKFGVALSNAVFRTAP